MEMTVLVEQLGEEKYRASTAYPLALEGEGHSRDEAVERLREQAVQRLKGSEFIHVSIPGGPDTNPWIEYAGLWKDHPTSMSFWRTSRNIAELWMGPIRRDEPLRAGHPQRFEDRRHGSGKPSFPCDPPIDPTSNRYLNCNLKAGPSRVWRRLIRPP
jgi:hypothetical protein